jgi:hypothetical protein
MLKRILQNLLSCFAAIVLTTMAVMSNPLYGSTLIAEHTPDHQAATSARTNQPDLPQAGKVNPVTSDREKLKNDAKATSDNPSAPFDPYDYDAIRESNRKTYGEGKETESK